MATPAASAAAPSASAAAPSASAAAPAAPAAPNAANAVYADILRLFRPYKDKRQVTNKIDAFIDASPKTNDAEMSNLARSLLNLKIHLETKLMREANCRYTFGLFTPASYGCDIREVFYDTDGNLLNRASLSKLTSFARYIPEKIPHILTDIDDTLFPHPSPIHSIAGRDESWLAKEPYPGISKFYQTFYNNLPIENYKYSTILSATPTVLKGGRLADPLYGRILGDNFGFLQGADRRRDALLSVARGIYRTGSLAPNLETMSDKKYQRFNEYRSIFPEYKLLFIGDNGQGDLIAGLRMLETDPDCMVFIHNIIVDGNFLFTRTKIRNVVAAAAAGRYEAARAAAAESVAAATARAEAAAARDARAEAAAARDARAARRATATAAPAEAAPEESPGRLFFFKNYLELAVIFRRLNFFTEEQLKTLKEAVTTDIRAKINEVCEVGTDCTVNKKIQHYTCGADSALHAPETVCIPSAVITSMRGGYRKTRMNRNKKRKVRKSRKY